MTRGGLVERRKSSDTPLRLRAIASASFDGSKIQKISSTTQINSKSDRNKKLQGAPTFEFSDWNF